MQRRKFSREFKLEAVKLARERGVSVSGRYLSLAEREEIALLLVQGHSLQEIGRRLGRSASTISREVRRNVTTRSGALDYRATVAQWHAERSARRPKAAKLASNPALRSYVEERLAGVVRTSSGNPVPRPAVSWKGRRHGPRQDRRWAWAWSPEQITRRLVVDFPDDETMRINRLAPSTIATRRRALERTIDDIITTPTSCDLTMKLRNRFARAREQLLTFAYWPSKVEPTNNACERDLRPAVIQRKITNGYRAMWAAQGEADIRTVVATARLTPGTNIFGTIAATLAV